VMALELGDVQVVFDDVDRGLHNSFSEYILVCIC
jgi:hypothetical protein